MFRTRFSIAIAAAFAQATTGAAMAGSPQYGEFELQARSNLIVNDNGWNLPPGSSFNSISASINNDAFVSFPVQIIPVDGQADSSAGIWHGQHGVGEIAARHDPEPGGEVSISDKVSVNLNGKTAYIINRDFSVYSIWIYDPVTGESTQVNPFPLTPAYISNVALSDDDIVGYQGRFGVSGRGFASSGDSSSVIHAADNTINPDSPYVSLYSPDMNTHRVIAGKVNVADTDHAEIRLFESDGNSTLVVEDRATNPLSLFQSFDNGLTVNDLGQVAVIVNLADGGGRAIYRFDGTEPTEIARVGENGITALEFFAPAINNAGQIAFRAQDTNGQAIYVGDGKTLTRVAGKGDPIDTDLGAGRIGQHIDNPSSWPIFSGMPGINDHGDVVFIAGLHPDGDTQTEWGTGVIVAYATVGDDTIFTDGFETPPE